ncbi:MAG: hypothetical protein AzoDbin1_04071 [Azoarcus sp.]|nr:hypothetical protein [Azoarcus sp.]
MHWTYLATTLKGQEKLSIVFWYYNVLAMFGVALIASAMTGIAMLLSAEPNPNLILVGFVLLIPYWLWAVASLWQCAFNVQNRVWGYFARGYVIYCATSVVASLAKIPYGAVPS